MLPSFDDLMKPFHDSKGREGTPSQTIGFNFGLPSLSAELHQTGREPISIEAEARQAIEGRQERLAADSGRAMLALMPAEEDVEGEPDEVFEPEIDIDELEATFEVQVDEAVMDAPEVESQPAEDPSRFADAAWQAAQPGAAPSRSDAAPPLETDINPIRMLGVLAPRVVLYAGGIFSTIFLLMAVLASQSGRLDNHRATYLSRADRSASGIAIVLVFASGFQCIRDFKQVTESAYKS